MLCAVPFANEHRSRLDPMLWLDSDWSACPLISREALEQTSRCRLQSAKSILLEAIG
jgi:hypothetical protein